MWGEGEREEESWQLRLCDTSWTAERDTYDRYETGKKGFELKTSDSRNRCSRSHDIGGVGGIGAGKDNRGWW